MNAVGTDKLEDVNKFFQIIINVCKKIVVTSSCVVGDERRKVPYIVIINIKLIKEGKKNGRSISFNIKCKR